MYFQPEIYSNCLYCFLGGRFWFIQEPDPHTQQHQEVYVAPHARKKNPGETWGPGELLDQVRFKHVFDPDPGDPGFFKGSGSVF